MWNENFQMNKLGLEKAEEPEIKLPTFVGSWRKQVSSRKIPNFASLTTWKLLSVWITKKLWKILKEMGISDHFTCLLRNLYVGQEGTARTGHEACDWFKIGKGIRQGCMLSPSHLTSMQSKSCKMPGCMNHKLEARFPGEISTTSDMQLIPL